MTLEEHINIGKMHSVVAYLILIVTIVVACPPLKDLQPCTCEMESDSAYITCSGLDNEHTLVTAVGVLKSKRYIHSLSIEHSQFYFIPHDAFEGCHFTELELQGTSLMALTDTDVAFVGLEDHLESLMMSDCVFMNEWDWSIFKDLRKLRKLEIVGSDMENIGEDMENINTTVVEDINFSNNKISYIHPFAFSSFKGLRFLDLSNNEIHELSRTMLPNPAEKLLSFDISYNKIEELTADIFTNIPALQFLSVGSNKILLLNENTFSPVWEQLEGFTAMGNELRCDCRLSWILTKKNPDSIRATCAMPKEVKGRNLDSLTSKDLWCFRRK